jgi:hypothetical protein
VCKKVSVVSPESIVEKTKEVLDWYTRDPISRSDLMPSGIHLPVVQEAVESNEKRHSKALSLATFP